MLANGTRSGSQTRKTRPLAISAVVAALLMAAALLGCDSGENAMAYHLTAHAEAVGQDNGRLTESFPSVSQLERGRLDQYRDGRAMVHPVVRRMAMER